MDQATAHLQATTQEIKRPLRPPAVHITPNLGGNSFAAGLDEVHQRLGWVALIYSVVYLAVHLISILGGAYAHQPGFSLPLINTVATICVLWGLMVFGLIRSGKLSSRALMITGLLFEVLAAAGIDVYLTWISIDPNQYMGLSWVTVWIVCFGLVVRLSPTPTLVGALGAASMTPLMYAIGVARGVSAWDGRTVLLLSFPNYVCVGVAFVSARIIYRMRQQVSEARAMGSYRLVEPLGKGGMGEVWLAQHQRLVRPAAIKLIRPSMLEGKNGMTAETAFRRFEREAQVTATLESANTVRLYDYGISDDGSFYYVMELLRGLDLERLVTRFGALPPERVVHILRQACHSLSEAHGKGLIHRDIKPANIYTCRMGQDFDFVKVLDFGLVKPLASPAEELGLTQAGTTAGTPAFIAPEMALGRVEVDSRTDIYSLGCVGYWLLTGKLLFHAASPLEMAMHHVQTKPVPPSEISETNIPAALDHVILACLEKDPAKRPQSMSELSQGLLETGLPNWSAAKASDWWRTHLPEISA